MSASKIAKSSAALLVLAFVVSCGKKEESKSAIDNNGSTPAATAPQAASTPQAPPDMASAAEPVTPPAPQSAPAPQAPPETASAAAPSPAILASADGEQPGMRVELRALKRDGRETVTLQFTVINDSDAEFSARTQLGATSHGDGDYQTVSGVHLVDPVNKKKYFVVRDAENQCVCSTGVYAIAAKSRVNLWAKFPALENEVADLSVVIPHFMPMEDVPIQ